jgi:transposase
MAHSKEIRALVVGYLWSGGSKAEETKRLIERTGATLLYLPPYSPELNPIEKDFANLKRIRQCV